MKISILTVEERAISSAQDFLKVGDEIECVLLSIDMKIILLGIVESRGSGSASKEQVAAMVQRTLKLKDDQMPKHLDSTDGLAVALCHHFQLISPTMQKGGSGWKAFIKDNPERIKS